MDTIRLFIDDMDFVEVGGDGWLALLYMSLCHKRRKPNIATLAQSDLLIWMLQSFSPEIRTYFINKHYADILYWVMAPGREKVAKLLLELSPVGAIDTVRSEGGFTTLQDHIIFTARDGHALGMILRFGADIHHLGFDTAYSPREETPLSLALYSSGSFQAFTAALRKRNIDLGPFVLHELRENFPLLNDGWTEQTLRALFEDEFKPDDGYIDLDICDECHCFFGSWRLRVEVAWQLHLEYLKGWHSESSSETMSGHQDLIGIASDASQDQIPMDPIQDLDVEECETEYETDQVSWERRFWQHRTVCISCWLHFKHGLRDPQSTMQNDSAEEGGDSEEDDSEDDFSPYLFNT